MNQCYHSNLNKVHGTPDIRLKRKGANVKIRALEGVPIGAFAPPNAGGWVSPRNVKFYYYFVILLFYGFESFFRTVL